MSPPGRPKGEPRALEREGDPVGERDAALLDEFCDHLWLEDGLAKNTLESYRRDLRLFGTWLAGRGGALGAASEADVLGYFAHRHASRHRPRASTQARLASSLKRFYQFLVREHRIAADPTLKLEPPKRPPRFPKTLTEADVEALLEVPDVGTPSSACATARCSSSSTRPGCGSPSSSGSSRAK